MLAINESLYALILVGRVMIAKNILEYNKSKNSLVALWQWVLIRFKYQSPIKNISSFSLEIFLSNWRTNSIDNAENCILFFRSISFNKDSAH